MPVGILGSLLICTILYMVFAYVMTELPIILTLQDNKVSHLLP